MANRYWRLREEQNRKQNIQDEKAYDREINSIYEQAFDEIQDEINSFYGKYARKEGISMAEAKKRVSRLDIEEYERKAARYVAEKNFSDKANEEMRLYNTTMKINRLEMLKSDIALRLTGAADRADKYSGKVLTEATRKELERQAGILGSTVHSWNTQAAEKIVKSPFRNATYSERVWNNASTIQYDLEKELRRTLIQGKAMDFSRLGPFAKCQERAKADARRLLKTELVRCRSEAQKAEYEENGFDEYEFMCLGSHPCEICQGLNGKHFPVRDLAKNMGEFAPPIHPNCRCTTAPWVDEDAYNDWLNAKADGSFSGGFDEFHQYRKSKYMDYKGTDTVGRSIVFNAGWGNEISAKEVKDYGKNFFVSDKIRVKPRDMHEISKYYYKALSNLSDENYIEPNLVVVSTEELTTGAIGRYSSSSNTLYVSINIRNPVKRKLIMHEMIHWRDAQAYKVKFGEVDDQSLIEYMCKIGKKKLDANGIDSYNISEISGYAKASYMLGRYDEAYVEYRLKDMG